MCSIRTAESVCAGHPDKLCDQIAVQFLAEPLKAPDRLRLQPAIGQFLDAVGQPAFEVAPVERRWLAVEQVAPLALQVGRRRGLERGQARGDGIGLVHAFLRCVGVA